MGGRKICMSVVERFDTRKKGRPEPVNDNTPVAVIAAFSRLNRSLRTQRDVNVYFALKRIFDVVVSAIAIVALAPLCVAVFVAVRLDSKGPALFSQVRWGKDGRKIRIYKFRSMVLEQCDVTGVAQTRPDDARITRVGAILRRSNIDELPQLFNVLKGDMSLIGPRCHAVGMQAGGMLYEDLVPHYHDRHAIRPGLTGLAQMRGLRGPTHQADKAKARIAADLYYIQNLSFWLDMKIMVGTLVSELRGGKGF
jgi:polysaccharide biosynthesis protein PslA